MKKLLLLAVCIAMAYGCSQSDLLTEPGLIQSSTKSVQRVAGLLQINAGGGTVQAHVSLQFLYISMYISPSITSILILAEVQVRRMVLLLL